MSNETPDLPEYVVLRMDQASWQRACGPLWSVVGTTRAASPGDAFRALVLKPNSVVDREVVGEYRVLPTEGGAHIAVELNLVDLAARAQAVV